MTVYKRTSDHLRESASKMIAVESGQKKVKIDSDSDESVKKSHDECKVKQEGTLSYSQMMKNVVKTRCEMRKRTYGKCALKAKRVLNKAKKFCIDLNLNMNINK